MNIDPNDPRLERLRALQEEFTKYPGAAPGGTGDTGLATNDAQGYSDLLGRRTEFMNTQRDLQGKGPMNTHYGGEIGSSPLPGTNWLPEQTNIQGRTPEAEQHYQNHLPLEGLRNYAKRNPVGY